MSNYRVIMAAKHHESDACVAINSHNIQAGCAGICSPRRRHCRDPRFVSRPEERIAGHPAHRRRRRVDTMRGAGIDITYPADVPTGGAARLTST